MQDHEKRIWEIRNLLERLNSPIFIGYSGGKDSSAVVSLIWRCLRRYRIENVRATVIYCDTEVENPVIDRHAKSSLKRLEAEAERTGLPIDCVVVKPRLDQGFFVRVIGRGYPTPTSSFRWCTKDIRIRPIRHFLRGRNAHTWIAIGTRWGESRQRDRTLMRFVGDEPEEKLIQRQKEGFPNASIVTPIIDYETADVWELLCEGKGPTAIDPSALAIIYMSS
jgi:DNA sulfur modification protein DndC